MRKITIGIRQSFDGVIQAPSGSEEDRGGGFDLGGWGWEFSDAIANEFMDEYLCRGAPYDLLLGRKTYEIFAGYWRLRSRTIPLPSDLTRPPNTSSHAAMTNSTGRSPTSYPVSMQSRS